VVLGKENMRMFNLAELIYDREEILIHPGNYIIGVNGRQPSNFFIKIVAVRFAFCYNIIKPCCAGWAGFHNPPS
jgi:hypothetical protein